jgi:hypothetical protein
MAYTLGASATLSNSVLNVIVEYGDADLLHPEFVQRLDLSVMNDQDVKLREMSLAAGEYSSNGEGAFKLGMIINEVEEPKYALVAIQSNQNGPLQVRVPVVVATQRAIQGS